MTEDAKKNKTLKVAALVLVAILVVALGSYAYWQMTEKQTNRNVVGTACLSITFDDTTKDKPDDISLDDAWPISDSEGSETKPYTFTIENHCGDAVNYSVGLESIEDVGKSSSDYLNYNYIRVKLDSESAKTYGTLTSLTNDINQSYTIRDTKEIAHHTLAANGSVTHSLRLWVDENTPLMEQDGSFNTEKYFYGKIKVVAGQNIEGDQQSVASGLKLLSDPNVPDVTVNNIQVGDLVGFGTEQFYIIGIDENNVKLLSRYLLNVGDYTNPNAPDGLQYAELGYTRPSLNSDPIEYREETIESYYGAVSFSSSNYWYDNSNNTWVSPYTENRFVYNENASISNYVNGYVQTLQTMGLSVTNGTLLSLEDMSSLCNTNINSSSNYSEQCPSYLLETSYWLGSADDDYGTVWIVGASGDLWFSVDFNKSDFIGVRPVITITLN